MPPGYKSISYGQLKKNWDRWEKKDIGTATEKDMIVEKDTITERDTAEETGIEDH
jgi:hypothetical protein